MSSVLNNAVLPAEAGLNNEDRCPLVILIDTSSSMYGRKIEELNHGLASFANELRSDPLASLRVEPLVIPFNSSIGTDRSWQTADDFHPQPCKASGATSLCEAVIAGLDAIEDRKQELRKLGHKSYRPWLWCITDGQPTDRERLPEAIRRVEEAENMKKASVFMIGVYGADMTVLQSLSPMRRALVLQGHKFNEMFLWLSGSLAARSACAIGEQVPMQSVSSWAVAP